MTALEALILGIVQGLTEFLPVSSDGHLVMAQTLLGLTGDVLPFVVALHAGTLVALLIYFRDRLMILLRERDRRYLGKILVGTIPAVVLGVTLADRIAAAFGSPLIASAGLAATGTLLLSLAWRRDRPDGADQPSWSGAWWIGCIQAAAMLPGFSRSGSTIALALWLGLAPKAAAEFSFLLGIPAITGALVFESGAIRAAAESDGRGLVLLGIFAAFGAGIGAIMLVFRLLEKREFQWFGAYCWAAALAFGAWMLWGGGSA
ncbi:MAG: undecaprenyl-diphosphate phosphatase [Gemmatimonadota bacterium]